MTCYHSPPNTFSTSCLISSAVATIFARTKHPAPPIFQTVLSNSSTPTANQTIRGQRHFNMIRIIRRVSITFNGEDVREPARLAPTNAVLPPRVIPMPNSLAAPQPLCAFNQLSICEPTREGFRSLQAFEQERWLATPSTLIFIVLRISTPSSARERIGRNTLTKEYPNFRMCHSVVRPHIPFLNPQL